MYLVDWKEIFPTDKVHVPCQLEGNSSSRQGVVNKSLGVGWGEGFLLPRRRRRSTPISSPPPISTPPTDSPPTQPPKQPTTQPTKPCPTPPSPLAPPKDAASAHEGVERKGVRRGLGMGSPIF
ncbi:hypothetical protein PGT21_007860 [Puccinia graminis f. sp. tritici]|uniref:Uncharacterized protein n=1 Tax=Puccinia graminis f. sp. tritici TaxID=56615 RepID=A0A5B0QMC4_PUCGR|nr:hypothetical protein PGT21_007860 [Puccinia graminis f. sp. tritici]